MGKSSRFDKPLIIVYYFILIKINSLSFMQGCLIYILQCHFDNDAKG